MRAALLLLCLLSVPAYAGDTESGTVLKAVQGLLDGWREADPAKVDAVLHPDFREVTYHLRDGKWEFSPVTRETLVALAGKLSKGSWDDKLLDPVVNVDGMIATVWSHYRFQVNYVEDGVAHAPVHCGVESFQLYKTDGQWKIVNFADTHLDDCPTR
jgi:hypothetical protein